VSLRLGILDQSPVVAGSDPEAAIAATIALVREAEKLGYHRYWFAEHHGRAHGFASASPELLIARLSAETSRIRLGSGGVLLSHYSALKVAENFRLLVAFAPGRVDLGIGRGTGSDEDTERALEGIAAHAVPYAQRISDLLGFLGSGFPDGHPFGSIAAAPVIRRAPEPWLLGSTESGAALAAQYGLPFAYAYFIKGDRPDITAAYRRDYRPSERFPHPRVLITVAAFCSPDADERDDFSATLALRRARVRLERDPLPPTRDEARTHEPSIEELPHIEDTKRISIVAEPAAIRARLEAVAGDHGAEDVMIVSVTPDYQSRIRSYASIAAAMR
jgi:luciferase family oxidoreductase group 1